MPFKNLESSDILLSSFDSTQYNYNTTEGASTTLSGSTFYRLPNYYVINNMFYRDLKQMYDINPGSYTVNVDNSVDYIGAVPTSSEAIISYTETRNLYDIEDKP